MLKYNFLRKYISSAAAVFLAFGMTLSAAAWNESPIETSAEETTAEEVTTPADEDISTEDDIIIVDEDDEENVPTEGDDEITEETTAATEEPPATQQTTETQQTTAAPQTDAPTYTAITEKQIYALQTINIRKGPSTDFEILGVLIANDGITAKGKSGDWYAVDYYGATGYVSASLVTDTPPITTEATVAAPETDEPVEAPEETTMPIETAEPEETSPATTEPPITNSEETKSEETDDETSAGTVSSDNGEGGGLKALLIALGSAAAAFLLIGVVPIVIHKIYHKKLYQY